jgi:hypothetical protein
MVAKISISVPDPALLEWAKRLAEREGRSLSAVFTEALRRERQRDARLRVEKWLGSAGELTPEREAAILADWGVAPAAAPAPAEPRPRTKRAARKRR